MMVLLMLMMLQLNLTFAWSVVALVISIKKKLLILTFVCLFVCLKRSNLTTADVQGTVCLVCEPDLSS